MKRENKNIIDLLKQHKIDVSKYDETFLSKSLQKRITEINCKSKEEYFLLLAEDANESELFNNSLNNSYSEFFRNPLTFSVLERIVIPALMLRKKETKRKEIRIWSAACAAGQESYSLAIILEECINGIDKNYNYRIFATDQCKTQLDEAIKGKYDLSSLNNMSLKRAKEFFTKQGDSYTIKTALKKNIDYSVFDLFSEKLLCPPVSIFGDFDIVVCANLLFYYKPEYRKTILQKATNCMAAGGYLITSESEREIFINYHYKEVFPQSGIFRV